MQSRIVLISDDSDFFEYIHPKLDLRAKDELFRFKFDELPDKFQLLQSSVLIVNSENSEAQTLGLLKMFPNTPIIIFSYNEDEEFKLNVFRAGALSFITPIISDDEFQAKVLSALKFSALLEKNKQYRDILVKKNLITKNNEVLLDYSSILEDELSKLDSSSTMAVLVAISPNEKSKFLLRPNQIETIILNNIRKNDVLMNYATNKYFLLLLDADINKAKKIWKKIQDLIPERIYAGFAKTFNKSRQQLVNEVLNDLHEAISYDRTCDDCNSQDLPIPQSNFKMFKQDFNKKIEQLVNPVFYHIKQKYSDKLLGVLFEQELSEGSYILTIKGRHASSSFKITTPGCTKINIDITYSSSKNIEAKRISFNPDEIEAGLLDDLLEQFIIEFKKEIDYETT